MSGIKGMGRGLRRELNQPPQPGDQQHGAWSKDQLLDMQTKFTQRMTQALQPEPPVTGGRAKASGD